MKNATTKGLALALDSNNKVCILITKKDAWSYPAITVESATITHTNPPDYFKDGWTAAIETDLSVYKSVTPFTVTSMMETTAGSQAKVDVPMSQLSDIAADNKLTPVEKNRRSWFGIHFIKLMQACELRQSLMVYLLLPMQRHSVL